MKFHVTLQDLRALNPCYDPATKLGNNWSGTLIDILDSDKVPDDDKIWAVTKLVDEKTARLFAVYCAREALKNVSNPDPRSIAAIDVAEKFAHGNATAEELSAAESAARSAAWSAAWSAARSAAESAAESAAWSAAWSAEESAAESAAWSAFVCKLKIMILELQPQQAVYGTDLAEQVLRYFGGKLKSEEARALHEKALSALVKKER